MNIAMNKMNDEKLAWCAFQLRQLGWQGGLGMLLLAGAALLCALIFPKYNAQIELNAQLNQLKTQRTTLSAAEKQETAVDVAHQFYALLPAQTEANDHIAKVLEAAKANGLVTNKIEYLPQVLPKVQVVQYQIKVPVLGTYLQIRQFVNQVLNAQPSLALSEITLKREDVNNDAVAANIQFNLYLKKTAY